MLQAISRWLAGATSIDGDSDGEERLHLAAAILLFEVAKADQMLEAVELERIAQVLRDHWSLDEQALAELMAVAGRESELSASLHAHVDTVNQAFSPQQKYRLLLGLWQIACVDGSIHHHEEHLVRRIADLLYLSHSDFIRAKHQVLAEEGAD